MTGDDIPSTPNVLDTTALSNFAYIDHVLAGLTGICTVPVVRDELKNGVADHPFLQSALDSLDNESPVVTIADHVGNREAILSAHLDPGEAQAFAVADTHDGRLVTDDGDARLFAREQGVTVIGSVGVLLAATDAGKIDESTADEWLSTRLDTTSRTGISRNIGNAANRRPRRIQGLRMTNERARIGDKGRRRRPLITHQRRS